MPTYDFVCDACGFEDVVFMRISERDEEVECPECLALMRRKVSAPALHGAIWDKKIRFGDDLVFETNQQARDWQKANPNAHPVSRTSSWWRNHKDRSRERAESTARKMGFRDFEDRKRSS